MANIELLRRAADKAIELYEKQQDPGYDGPAWDQSDWRQPILNATNAAISSSWPVGGNRASCGTALCLAGWVCQIDAEDHGQEDPWAYPHNSDFSHYLLAREDDPAMDKHRRGDVEVVYAADRAARLLELNQEERQLLFLDTGTDPEDLRESVAQIVSGQLWDEDEEGDDE